MLEVWTNTSSWVLLSQTFFLPRVDLYSDSHGICRDHKEKVIGNKDCIGKMCDSVVCIIDFTAIRYNQSKVLGEID